ncbi:MAG TPA: glycosyltransferase [Flavisolibacter sp.]|nr:glycosyltransferase [Flavisolibacter sp.]
MKIDKIAIACFKKDMNLLKPCVASIRYWYPNVEIFLIKDYSQGDFSTEEMEKAFGVKDFPTDRRQFGWGWGKFALLLAKQKERYLFLDSDVVFLGPVLDELAKYPEDFVVTGMQEKDKFNGTINGHYIDMKKIETFDPSYQYPGYGFNTGQIILTSGIVNKEDCASVVEFEPKFRSRHPEIFKHADQGVLNYVLVKAAQKGKANIRYADFWIWPGLPEANAIDLEGIRRKKGIPYILHWAGVKPVDFRRFPRYDILRFYEDFYYAKVPNGKWKQRWKYYTRLAIVKAKVLKYTLLRRQYNK